MPICLLHSFDCRQDVSVPDRCSEAPHIRDTKNLCIIKKKCVVTGANEHPCAVAPLGYILVPELPQYLQVLSISNSFCIHI